MHAHRTADWRQQYGPWAVVTGASDGIGRAFALRVADRGVNVALAARRLDRLEELAQTIRNRGVDARIIPVDLAEGDGVAVVQAMTRDLEVGLFVACAGFGTSGPFLKSSVERELEMLRVNCGAVLALTQHFARASAARGRGGIILMSSIVAFQGVPGAASYAATKAYVQTLAEGLAREVEPRGVDVVACAPGPVRSGFGARADMQMSMAAIPETVVEPTLDALGKRVTVRPGALSMLLGVSLAATPRWLRVRILERVMGGMISHQRGAAQA